MDRFQSHPPLNPPHESSVFENFSLEVARSLRIVGMPQDPGTTLKRNSRPALPLRFFGSQPNLPQPSCRFALNSVAATWKTKLYGRVATFPSNIPSVHRTFPGGLYDPACYRRANPGIMMRFNASPCSESIRLICQRLIKTPELILICMPRRWSGCPRSHGGRSAPAWFPTTVGSQVCSSSIFPALCSHAAMKIRSWSLEPMASVPS